MGVVAPMVAPVRAPTKTRIVQAGLRVATVPRENHIWTRIAQSRAEFVELRAPTIINGVQTGLRVATAPRIEIICQRIVESPADFASRLTNFLISSVFSDKSENIVQLMIVLYIICLIIIRYIVCKAFLS